jgi:serine/threonine-protein kinase
MSLHPGQRVGPYEIAAEIGAGGMGVVYRARDLRLQRDVAVKVLPESLAADPERLARFQREAQLLASLNHPNIAQIYGFEEGPVTGDGPVERRLQPARALVMELVEGPTLAERLERRAGPFGPAGAVVGSAGSSGPEGPGLHVDDALAIPSDGVPLLS